MIASSTTAARKWWGRFLRRRGEQLAFAILYDFLGDKERAGALSEPFMKQVVANLDNDWVLTGTDIDTFLRSKAAT